MSDLIERLRAHAALHRGLGVDDDDEQAQWARDLLTAADEIERLTAERDDLLTRLDLESGTVDMIARERDELRRQLAEAEQDARRYRWLRKFARQNTAYDVYKDGAHWSVGLHSDDHRQTFDQAIDAAMGASNE